MKIQLVVELESEHLNAFEKFLSSLNGKAPAKSGKTKVADPEPDETDEDETELDFLNDSDEETTIDADTIREAIKERSKDAKKKANIAKLFAKFKVKNVSGLKEAQFEKFYEYLTKI